MKFVSQLIRHIGSCITAEKGKRIFYAVVNIAFIAIAVLSGWGAIYSDSSAFWLGRFKGMGNNVQRNLYRGIAIIDCMRCVCDSFFNRRRDRSVNSYCC